MKKNDLKYCPFCEIISGQPERKPIYVDDLIAVIKPLHGVNPGHIMVVPKKHYQSILELPPKVSKALSVAIKKFAKKLASQRGVTGINILSANGKDAGQSVFHFHWHLIPRRKNDNLWLWIDKK